MGQQQQQLNQASRQVQFNAQQQQLNQASRQVQLSQQQKTQQQQQLNQASRQVQLSQQQQTQQQQQQLNQATRQVQLSQQQPIQQQQQLNQASRQAQVQLSEQQQTQQQLNQAARQVQLNQQQLNQASRQVQLNQANTQNQFNQQQQNQQARVTLTNQQNDQQNQQARVTLTNQHNQQGQRIQTNQRQEANVAGQSAQLQNAQAFNLQQSNILFRSSAEGALVEEIRFDEDQAISGVFEPLNLPSGASAILGNIDTSFSCYEMPYGYYADRDNNCNLFHVCNPTLFSDGSIETYQYSFMCGEGTVFDQKELTCKVPVDAISCQESPSYFYVNEYFGIIGEL